ncbi:ABC transporter permease [Leifsonia sp. L25]|uniref:ABC transporter permease n=1 Tax=Actinomycetes TaxID=1760 RepID=UPI003D68C249
MTATVVLRDSDALVTLAYPAPPAWIPIARAIEAAGYAPSDIVVIRQDGTVETDILRINLSTTLIAGFMAIVFLGTSVPIVSMRGRGTLRLLGTTPLPRLTFILAQSPIRILLGLAEAATVVIIAWTQGYASFAHSGRLAVTLAIGLGMLFSFGFLLASRSRNPDLIGQLSGLIPVLIVLTSGTMFPLQGVPDVVLALMRSVPTTWFIQATSADIAGTVPFVSVYALWAMMGVVTVICTLFAARIFIWDQAEARTAARRH